MKASTLAAFSGTWLHVAEREALPHKLSAELFNCLTDPDSVTLFFFWSANPHEQQQAVNHTSW